MKLFGYPVFGFILPFIGKRKIPLNADGSFVDDGADDLLDSSGPLFVRPVVFEWLGFGFPITRSLVYSTMTGEPVEPAWAEAGG